MAVCDVCGQEMLLYRSCTLERVILADGSYKRRRYSPGRGSRGVKPPVCGDCGTPRDGFHHPGCDMEACPRCRRQAITCPCGEGLSTDPLPGA
jgi:hypothetical protein